jgi:hypothetical protein
MCRDHRVQSSRYRTWTAALLSALVLGVSGSGCLVQAINRAAVLTILPSAGLGAPCDELELRAMISEIIEETAGTDDDCTLGRKHVPVAEDEILVSCSVDVSDAHVWWWLQALSSEAKRSGCRVRIGTGSAYAFGQ